MPAVRPPPPKGTTTESTSGMSSRISKPIVPFPSIILGSLKGWMKIDPSSGPYRWVVTTFQTSSKETWMILAPNRLMACSFVSGALSGTIAEQGIPFCFACQAKACAMFPALQVYTPRDFAAGPARAIALEAPLTLNEPVGCKFSSFRKISMSESAFNLTMGVRNTVPRILALASSI